ncbi:MAG TPA: 4-(cytidine 5'-diphospho)-2-C-methyl-D-erythritol kinase [Puia sp.]|nr:4-(cytidine 5'-diphospho)-2-C-methyl-D-erythritol kinase [Puia sp.]
MIAFPQAKINFGLSVVSKRPDGFHNIETVFYPIPLVDVLEIVPASNLSLTITGLALEGNEESNLVSRAYRLLKQDYHEITPLAIHLHKHIPAGAGLGGGSSDAAHMLRMLNTYFKLNISEGRLAQYALKLGSDCPFFIKPAPAFASGRGEMLKPIQLDLSNYSILLVHPEIHISTPWAFSQITPGKPAKAISTLIDSPPATWRDQLLNDFERPVFNQYPQLKQIKEDLYKAGAVYASLSGSGSTLYGLFNKGEMPEKGIATPTRQTFIP